MDLLVFVKFFLVILGTCRLLTRENHRVLQNPYSLAVEDYVYWHQMTRVIGYSVLECTKNYSAFVVSYNVLG